MAKAKETVLEINLNALEQNYTYLRSKLAPKTKFLAVVKAFAYGHDPLLIAKKLQTIGADYLAVAYASEGVALRKGGITLPILVLHPQPANFNYLFEYSLEPSIYSFKLLKDFMVFASAKKAVGFPIHLKFNTGLNRLGFKESDIKNICGSIGAASTVKLISFFSHLAASEDHNEKAFTSAQITLFKKIARQIEDGVGPQIMKHLLNTSGILNFPAEQFDMVRSGIGLYGFGNDEIYKKSLRPIATLKTIISQIHHLEENESVGYNRAFIATKSMVTATLPIGHADGISRQYGNGKASVMVNGKNCAIIGNVCMDMMMIDITDVPCSEGDEVIIFGEKHDASLFAESADTIPYELLTAISHRVKRSIIS